MTRRVRWTRAAEQDALDLYIHIGQDNPAAAEQVLRRIDQALATILTQPGIGTRRRRYGENVRSFPVFSYIFFYREIDDGIERRFVQIGRPRPADSGQSHPRHRQLHR